MRVVAAGAWPLWNPLVGFGAPMLADPGYQAAYPPTWLNLVMPTHRYYTVFVIAHGLWAGAGAWLLARRWGLGPLGAFTTAGTWMSSGPLLSLASMNHHFAGASWIAWVLVALEDALAAPGLRAAVRLGLAGAALLLAGSGDMGLLAALLASGRLGFHLAVAPSHGAAAVQAARALAVGAVVSLALAAVQWMPTAELAAHAPRRALPLQTNAYWSVHPLSLADLLAPGLLAATPLQAPWRETLFDGREPFLARFYLGAGTAALAMAGALAARGWLRAYAAMGVVAAITCAAGRYAPLHGWLLLLPPFRMMRYPVKFLLPAALLWALLAGLGAEALGSRDPRVARTARAALLGALAFGAALALLAPWRAAEAAAALAPADRVGDAAAHLLAVALRAAVSMMAVAALGWLALRRGSGRLAVAAAVLATLDLAAAGREVNPLAPAALALHRPALVDALRARGDSRVYARQEPMARLNTELRRGPAGWDPEWSFVLGLQDALLPPAAARWGLKGSFDGDFTGLASPAQSELTLRVAQRGGTAAGLRLLQAANVGSVVSMTAEPFPGLARLAEWPSVFAAPVRLHAVPDPLPRAYAVSRARVVPAEAVLATLEAPDFDPRAEVVLSVDAGLAAAGPGPAGPVRVVSEGPDEIVLEAELSRPAVVVLLEASAGGWTALVDGAPAPLLTANVLFRAVAAPAGRHHVAFRYRPRSALLGAAVTSLAVVALALAAAARSARLRRGFGLESPA